MTAALLIAVLVLVAASYVRLGVLLDEVRRVRLSLNPGQRVPGTRTPAAPGPWSGRPRPVPPSTRPDTT